MVWVWVWVALACGEADGREDGLKRLGVDVEWKSKRVEQLSVAQ